MYQALYRKYRPKDFDSVVGQDSIIKTLKNSIINHNFSHAYMFFGPRGTGKTTISKIFARNINCLNPIDGLACGKCDNCKVSFSKECVDIIEIDAASNNGVDEIRELRNKISLVPSELKYKVYIIDEVHMLSLGAFNALLKTLEEPPEHIVFILATTDPQKVPDTIISRCQCFSFKRIPSGIIHDKIQSICKNEKIDIDDDVINNISILSDGGLRDALSSLDKLTSYTSNKITLNDFYDVNGIVSDQQLNLFLKAISDNNPSLVLKYIDDFDSCGKNLLQILVQLLNYARNLIVDYYVNHVDNSFSIEYLQEFANSLNENMFDIKKSNNTRICFELFVLKFINKYNVNKGIGKNSFSSITNEQIINVKNDTLTDNNIVNNSSDNDEEFDFSKEYSNEEDNDFDDSSLNIDNSVTINKIPKVLNIADIISARINNTLALANKELLKKENQNFSLLNDYTFDQEIGFIVCALLDSKIRAVSEDNMILSYEYDSTVKQNLLYLDKMSEVYYKITNSLKKIAIITDDEWNKIKNDYISNLKNGKKYEIIKEPEVVLEDIKNNDIISNSAVELFGDIVEIE